MNNFDDGRRMAAEQTPARACRGAVAAAVFPGPALLRAARMAENMPGPRPVLIVDDDAALGATLAEQLALDGEFAPVPVADLASAEAALSATGARFDAILLDIRLPDGDGRQFCAELRRRGARMPILMLTDAGADVVPGLEAGANDAIAKPFRLNELFARLRAQLRVFDHSDDAVLAIGPYVFRPAAKLLLEPTKNRRIRLTEKETAILRFLHRAGGAAVPRQVLLNEVWGYSDAIATHTLETHIYRLRRKIEPDPTEARLLITDAGGYRLDLRPEPG
jgi:DNA-binding response OmpR family regulator